jgi:hypothetical protein
VPLIVWAAAQPQYKSLTEPKKQSFSANGAAKPNVQEQNLQ